MIRARWESRSVSEIFAVSEDLTAGDLLLFPFHFYEGGQDLGIEWSRESVIVTLAT